MINFHGQNKTSAYFEGWYLKHQTKGRFVALIPAFHIDEAGKKSASVQIITENGAASISFPVEQFAANLNCFKVRIGENTFSSKGIKVDLQSDKISVKGKLFYTAFTPLASDIMGPFRFFHNMQCNHGVVSLTHRLSGELKVNGELIDFGDGIGYIEKDWGSSFPRSYLWSQANWFDKDDCCLMLSVADIPILGGCFTGCICAILYEGKEYRLATYRGVKIRKYSNEEIIIEQGKYRLEVLLVEQKAYGLQAPQQGGMTRIIHESPSCKVQYRFFVDKQLLFHLFSDSASFEQSSGGK